MPESLAVVGNVLRNPVLARIEGGFTVFSMAEWAAWLAIAVYAFGRGGAAEAGLVGFAMGFAGLVFAPIGGVLGDRWPRARVLVGSYLGQALMATGATVALLGGVSPLAYAFATLWSASIALSRPAVASLLPEVVDTPDELTAANVASGIAEGIGALAGPLVAGVLLGVAGSAAVFAACAAGLALSAIVLLPTARNSTLPVTETTDGSGSTGLGAAAAAAIREVTAGAGAVAGDRRLAGVFVVLAASSTLLGALGVFTIVVAIDLLGLDDAAAAYLTAAAGLGALAGSALSASLVGRDRLGRPIIVAAVIFGLSVAALAFVASPVVIGVVLAATGIGYAFAYVAATTLIQRLVGDDVMTRVFGLGESMTVGGEAVGGILVPVLIVLFGASGAIVVAGLGLVVIALVTAPTFIRGDRAAPGLMGELRTITAVPMFRPLSAPVVERLARDAIPVEIASGESLIRAGDRGDRFYIIVSGQADVEIDGVVTGRVGPGSGVGEIALLHDIPRTATIRAIEPMTALAILREPFLAAVTGQPRSRAMAQQVAQRRLAGDAGDI